MNPALSLHGPLALAATAFLGAAGAAPAAAQELSSLWDIQPSEAWTAPRELASGDMLVEPAILPRELIELIEDVPGTSGDGLLLKGDLLYRVATSAGKVYCTVDGQPPIGSEARFAHTILICLVDRDSDGSFEGHFRREATRGVPFIFGSVPEKLRPLAPVRFEARPITALAGRFAMRVALDGDPAKAKQLRFTFTAGDKTSKLLLTATARVRNGAYPQQFEVLGGLFELTGVSGVKAVVRMTVPTTHYPFLLEPGSIKF